MNLSLKKIKDISGKCCVSILLNTHRTRPDNEQDPLALKNLTKEALSRINDGQYPKDLAEKVSSRLEKLAASIDHQHNLESLVLFVNEDVAEYLRLPIKVEARVSLGGTFATRDLVRAFNQSRNYYVLVLSRDRARLIEAYNDKVVQEIENEDFPFENLSNKPAGSAEAAVANRVTNLQQEFFNTVDKKVNKAITGNPHRVFVCTEESNYAQLLKVADKKDNLLGNLNGNHMHKKAFEIVEEIWPLVLDLRKENQKERVAELEKAANNGQVLTELTDIWKAVKEGRGKTIFVAKGFFQPARVTDDIVEVIHEDALKENESIDDIIDDMIEFNLEYGGDSVFLPEDELKKYGGLALTTRY